MYGYTREVNPDFHRLGIVYNFGFFTHILVRDTVEVVLINLDVIGRVYSNSLLLLEEEPCRRQRKQIWQFFLLELLPAAIGFVFTITVVVQVIKFIQPMIEFIV